MKTRTTLKRICFAAFTLLVLSSTAPACDDGNLNTIMEVETLQSYMKEHTSLRLYLHAISNYREPLYICTYDVNTGSAVTQNPVGKYGSTAGIAYGEVTAVEIPYLETDINLFKGVTTVFVKSALNPCPATETEALGDPDFTSNTVMVAAGEDLDQSMILSPNGHLPVSRGGENWMVCGESGTESCDLINNGMYSYSGHGVPFSPNPPSEPSKINLTSWDFGDVFDIQKPTRTFCWTDTAGTSLRIGVNPAPYSYDPPDDGWTELPPLEEGTIHLHDGEVDCNAVNIEDALATVTLPFDATFGPDGSKIAFTAGTSGMLIIVGQPYPGIPAEAGLRIIPVLNWLE